MLAVKLAEIGGEYAHAHKCEGRSQPGRKPTPSPPPLV